MLKFKQLGVTPSNLNVVIRPLADFNHKKSDGDNGYYIVADTWGTCFFRISKTRDHIDICDFKEPKKRRTYTKIPISLMPKVFFGYVNYREGETFKIIMPTAARVIGMHDHTPSACGRWWSASFLVYSPTGEAPTVESATGEAVPSTAELKLQEKDGQGRLRSYSIDDLMRFNRDGSPCKVRHIYTNEGFVITQHNRTIKNIKNIKELLETTSVTRSQRRSGGSGERR